MIGPGVVVCDRYRVVRVLGEGGMGVVFEAEHTGVGRKVALKALRADFAKTPDVVARFQREARAAAAIGHDNIIDVIDFGTFEGAPFMVMEMLKGEALDERIARKGKLPLENAAYILQQVLSALGAAHEAGIIHRDLKPENVFLTQKAGIPDFVKLLDFGIAKLRVDETGADGKVRAMTQAGTVLGTPHYMAPEQALAERDLDSRIDLYSAGVMLYEMTTGTVPFDSESDAEILMEIAYRLHPLVPPSGRDPTLPPELDAIVLRALSKNRDDRYQDAAAFAAALSPFVATPAPMADTTAKSVRISVSFDGEPRAIEPRAPSSATLIDGSPPSLAPPPIDAMTSAPARSKRPSLALVGAGLTLVLALGGVAALLAHRNPSAPASLDNHAVAPPTSASTDPPAAQVDPNIHIELEQLPAEAVVTLDGVRMAGRSFSLARGTTHAMRVELAGHDAYVTTLVADRDRAIAITLAPSAPAPVRPAAEASAHAIAVARPTIAVARPTIAPTTRPPPSSVTHVSPTAAPSAQTPPAHVNHVANPLPVSNEF